MKRELSFKIEEIRERYNPKMYKRRESYVHTITGTAIISGEDIEILIDDQKQPYGYFETKDNRFRKFFKKLMDATK